METLKFPELHDDENTRQNLGGDKSRDLGNNYNLKCYKQK